MQVGVVFPQMELGEESRVIREFATSVEALGFDHILAYDHVIGPNPASRPGYDRPFSHESVMYDPLVLFGFLAGITSQLTFASGVLVMPPRQAVLVAKQAACVDVFTEGRLRLGVGLGWNQLEYEALGTEWSTRAERLEEQVEVMRRLWTEPSPTYHGKWHHISDGGMRPRPQQHGIPVWFGGDSEGAKARAARLGDGWFPLDFAAEPVRTVRDFRARVQLAGREPDQVGIERIIGVGIHMRGAVQSVESITSEIEAWHAAGATHVSIDTLAAGLEELPRRLDFLASVKDRLG